MTILRNPGTGYSFTLQDGKSGTVEVTGLSPETIDSAIQQVQASGTGGIPGGGGETAQVSGGRTATQILADFRAGRISSQQALQELTAFLVSKGADQTSAAATAQSSLQAAGGPSLTTNISATPTATPEFTGGVQNLPPDVRQGPVFAPFGEVSADRRTAFQGFLGEQFPQGIGRQASQALAGQFNALSPAFETLRGLEAIPAGTSFPDFLSQNLGQGGFDPRDVARQAAGIFGRTDLTPNQSDFRTFLSENPRSQFQLALQSRLQGIPGFLAGTARNVAERRFGQFQTNVPIDPLTGQPAFEQHPFLPEFFRSGGF